MEHLNAILKINAMTKTIIVSIVFILLSSSVMASQNATTVADEKEITQLSNQLPARNNAELSRIMTELSHYRGKAVDILAAALVSPGQGDDSKQRYALSGLAKFSSEGDDPYLKMQLSAALCQAIEDSSDDEVKDFLFQELQYVAGDEAVLTAASYLSHNRLCEPATRVLVRVNSQASKSALQNELSTAGPSEKIVIVQSLGNTGCLASADVLILMAESAEPALKKVILRSLSETAGIEAAVILKTQAEKAGYNYDQTEAVASWLNFLGRLADNGNKEFAKEALKKIVLNPDVPVHTRNAALSLLN